MRDAKKKRITDKDIDAVVLKVNQALDVPETPYTRDDQGRMCPNAGAYYINRSAEPERLVQMIDGGGNIEVCVPSSVLKPELHRLVCAFLTGLLRGGRVLPVEVEEDGEGPQDEGGIFEGAGAAPPPPPMPESSPPPDDDHSTTMGGSEA